jgi:hypothetical protein
MEMEMATAMEMATERVTATVTPGTATSPPS